MFVCATKDTLNTFAVSRLVALYHSPNAYAIDNVSHSTKTRYFSYTT